MFLLEICKLIENIIYLPFKLLKAKRKITFISRQGDATPLEFQMIIDSLKDEDIKIVSIAKMLHKNPKSLIENFFLFFKEMYHIATSKMLIVDGYCIMASTLKHKKNLIIMQTWHANGIVKKIGLQTLENRTPFQRRLAKHMNMHKNYDYVLSSSKETSKVFLEAFDINKKSLLEIGTPMLDYLYNKDNKIEDKIFERNGKLNVIYMPTVRKGEKLDMQGLLDGFDFKKYNLFLKLHPAYQDNNIDSRIKLIKGYSGEQVLSVADYIITDYSNIMFEAGLQDIPVILYIPDIVKYKKNPGLNINIEKEFKYTTRDIKEVLKMLNNKYDIKYLKKFVKKYIEIYDGKCTERIKEFILEKLG